MEPSPNVHGVWPNEGPLPTYRALQDESWNSTCVSSKRQCDRRPHLSDAMHARLGPQAPSKNRLRTTMNQKAYPGPSVAPITQGYPLHQQLR